MAESVTVARPYAKAAFAFAQEHNTFAQWSAMLGFASAVIANETLSVLLDDPQLTAEKQAELFITVCGDKLDQAGKNFVHQLTQNKRLSVLPDVAVLFDKLLAEHQRKQDVNILSAFALSAAEQDALSKALERKLGKAVSVQSQVDASLIGGVVIRAGDMVIDNSVRGQLQQLSQALR